VVVPSRWLKLHVDYFSLRPLALDSVQVVCAEIGEEMIQVKDETIEDDINYKSGHLSSSVRTLAVVTTIHYHTWWRHGSRLLSQQSLCLKLVAESSIAH
jgi:hypothetical protein